METAVSDACWARFHEAIVNGRADVCDTLLTSATCPDVDECLRALSPSQRLRHLDRIAFKKLKTTSLHMAALYRRPELVELLLRHGADVTVMDGFGRGPAAVLLEHWPRVTFPPTTPISALPLLLHPQATYPVSPPLLEQLDRAHVSDTLLQLLVGKDNFVNNPNHYASSSAGGGGREMELFRQQVGTWRARSARCLKLMLAHGLQVNQMADCRRASTLLHIAARYDLVDVIELIFNLGQKKQEPLDEADECYDDGRSKGSHTSSGDGPVKCLDPETAKTDIKCTIKRTAADTGLASPRAEETLNPCSTVWSYLSCHQTEDLDNLVLEDESEEEEAETGSRLAQPGNKEEEGVGSALGRLRRSMGRQAQQVLWDWQHHCPWFRLGLGLGRKNKLCEQAGARHCGDSDRRSSASRLHLPTSAATLAKVTVRKESDLQQNQDASATDTRYHPPPVDLEVQNGVGKTPLLVAVDRGSLRAAHCLLEHGADLRTSDHYGRSIVHLLSERDATFDLLLREVVRRGISVMGEDHGGNTPLHTAAYMGLSSKARFLIASGACPDRCNLAGRSPLFLSLQRRDASARETILLFLLASRAMCVRDRQGRLPALLKSEENAGSLQHADALHKEGDTLLRRCLLVVRRAVGLQRLLYMGQWALLDLPCPSAVLRAVYGEEERAIVDDLCL